MSEVLVLRDEVGWSAVKVVADAQGWKLREETARAHLVLASQRWSTTSGEEVTYVADHPGGAQSLRITGVGASALAQRLRQWLPCHTEDELLAVVLDGDPPDPVACVRVASKLAACRPVRSDPRHVSALGRLLAHPEDAVRRAGIRSAYGCDWPELRTLIRERCRREPRLEPQLEELRAYLDELEEGR